MSPVEQDTIQLLQVFPREVWQIILQVTDTFTFLKLRHLCQLFTSLSISLRSQILFRAVANSVCKGILKSSTFPTTYVPFFIKCRQVCRAWKQGVDVFLENPEPHLQFIPSDHYFHYPNQHLNNFITKFRNAKDAQVFHRKFVASHSDSNPFVSRYVFISLDEMQNNLEFRGEMCQVLERWGSHIWFAYFNIPHILPDAYLLFQRFLEYLPNLKGLHAPVINVGDMVDPNHRFDNFPPFKHFPKLQCVKTYDLPGFVWERFRESNLHVTQVHVVTPEEVSRRSVPPRR